MPVTMAKMSTITTITMTARSKIARACGDCGLNTFTTSALNSAALATTKFTSAQVWRRLRANARRFVYLRFEMERVVLNAPPPLIIFEAADRSNDRMKSGRAKRLAPFQGHLSFEIFDVAADAGDCGEL